MRIFLLAFATTAIAFTTGTTQIAAHDYRYCLQGEEFGAGACNFTTLQQCQTTASGLMASCGVDLALSNAAPLDRDRARASLALHVAHHR
jgi:hypothetical protein